MSYDLEAAQAVFTKPHERYVLDFHEGVVQGVYVHDEHGPWYVFAMLPETLREQQFCLRPLEDASAVDRVRNLETIDEADWLTKLGLQTLLPACGPQAFRLRKVDGEITVEEMSDAERVAARPISAQYLERKSPG